jgi:hypothetical protein
MGVIFLPFLGAFFLLSFAGVSSRLWMTLPSTTRANKRMKKSWSLVIIRLSNMIAK